MKPKILLIGKAGQIGRELVPLLERAGELTAMDRHGLDLSMPDEIRRVVRAMRPDWIVNAAAYTAVDRAESDEASARSINAVAPGVMAEEAKQLGALLVHYSTDYVFDGTKGQPYEEEDPPHPLSVYGRTKLEGESAIQQIGPAYLILRTAWVYAREGRNFLLAVLRLATEKQELRIVRDQVGAPTWSREIAAATADILSQLQTGPKGLPAWSEIKDIYHVSAGGETNWFEFARAILGLASSQMRPADWFTAATMNRPLIARHVVPIATAEYPTPARRPAYSVLANRKVNDKFGVRLPDWETQLRSAFSEGVAEGQGPKPIAEHLR